MPDVYTIPLVSLGTGSMGIQIAQAAGQQYNGTNPTGLQTVVNGMCKYAVPVTPAAQGGLFDFFAGEPHVAWLYANLGSASVPYTLSIVDLDSTNSDAVIAGETIQVMGGAAQYLTLGPYRLLTRQALQLVTTGASAAMVARVIAISEKGFRG